MKDEAKKNSDFDKKSKKIVRNIVGMSVTRSGSMEITRDFNFGNVAVTCGTYQRRQANV